MSASEGLGSIYIDIEMETAELLTGTKAAIEAMNSINAAAKSTGSGLNTLDSSAASAGDSFTELAGYANSMDNQLKKLNTNVSAIAQAMDQAKSGTSGASSEFSRAESIIEALGNQLAILEEEQEESARSAAILAAQLRAGSKATDEEKQKIGELTGRLYDMKNSSDAGVKSHTNWKSSMQQAGYQVQDFIVQVQGGQSALVAFSQQGSQLASAFGAGGAIVGSLIALGSILTGVLITSLNGGKTAMEALADAADAMDKVITISQSGIAALSDKYANLAWVNAEAATILRNQALIEYNNAIGKIPSAITDASNSLLSFADKAISSIAGGYASVQGFNDRLASLNITTDNYSDAMRQAWSAGSAFNSTTLSIGNTVDAIASKFGISQQQAYQFAKQLSDIAKNPTPEALQALVLQLQNTTSSTQNGKNALIDFLGKLTEVVSQAANAKINLSALGNEMDNLTVSQKNAIKQSERTLALSKLEGEARARLQAQYAAEDAGFTGDDPLVKQMEDEAAAAYANTKAQQDKKKADNEAAAAAKRAATQQENVAQKLANLKQKSDLAADSTQQMSREQAILTAQQSLGKGATQEQIKQAGEYASKIWDTAAALKAQNAVPELKENANYNTQKQALESLKGQKDANGQLILSQQQYNQASEKLEADHQSNLAKIKAQQVVTPQQSALGEVDPVQQLANQHAQELALIQQFETQKGQITQRGLELMNAANVQYEKARSDAQWALFTEQSVGYEALGAAVDSFGQGASSALAGVISGTESASDAARNLANTILDNVIQTFVEMGMQQVRAAVMGTAAQEAGIATVTAAQVGSLATTTAASTASAATTTAAWTPAALVASIGSFGGAVAIGLGALVAALAVGSALSGKRKNGGPVSAGGLYQVGENGLPEIYKASNGSQYMIPGDNGSVISNKNMQGGGVSLQINSVVHNYSTGAQATNRVTQNGSSVLIETFLNDLERGGPMSSQMQSTFGLSRRANGDY